MSSSSTFPAGRPLWLDRLGHVRNVVRQEVITRHLARHLPPAPATILDVGAGQGEQAIRLAAGGHHVTAIEPDPAMRERFETALAGESPSVREVVELLAGGTDDLAGVLGSREYDVVLLLGVLMYLPATEPVLAELARHVRPGGILAAAVRTTTSALWRPAARQDWAGARAAFDEDERARAEGRDVRYLNEIGAPARAVRLEELVASAGEHGLRIEEWYGVRIAVDAEEEDPAPPSSPTELADLIDVEERLGRLDPFRSLGQLTLVVLRR